MTTSKKEIPKQKTSTALEAIILALLIHLVFLVVLYISDEGLLSSKNQAVSKDVDVEMLELTEELLEVVPEPEDELADILEKYKNVTSKENEEYTDEVRSYSFNKSKVDDQVLEELLNMEREEFEKLKKDGVIPEDVTQEDIKKQDKEKKDPTKDTSEDQPNSFSKATSNYDFSRSHERKKDPAYMCRLFGQIVVEISVDRDGLVTSAKAISGDLDKDCLREQSENYASKWKFKASSDSPKSEKGTITFTFLPQ